MARKLPDLTFPQIVYGRTEAPWDMRCLLYFGGAATDFRLLPARIASGELGKPDLSRLPLVQALHGVLTDRLGDAGSRSSTRGSLTILRQLYSWADDQGPMGTIPLTIQTIQKDYTRWTDHLLYRARELSDILPRTALNQAGNAGRAIDEVLGLEIGLLRKTRIFTTFAGAHRKKGRSKQNLEQAFSFGHALFDITQSLTAETIRSPLPIKLRFRDGTVLEEWTRLRDPSKVKYLSPDMPDSWNKRYVTAQRDAWSADTSLRTRRPLANLRIEAELLTFIAQTNMNLAQAHTLKMGRFSYASHLDGYQVRRRYKNRRAGEVEFEIFSEYRPYFEAYLSWREDVMGDESDLLFPIESVHERAKDNPPTFSSLKNRLKLLGIPFVTPRALRKTRLNWVRRRKNDDDLAAEMGQHTLETSLSNYDEPDHQVAMVEISRFHEVSASAIDAPGPVDCNGGEPKPITDNPNISAPDCISPAGCIFCSEQRDVDTADHMWSLATFRHLKSLELARYRPPANGAAPHPANEAISIITRKFELFRAGNERRARWIDEALDRIEEGYFHPKWDGFVRLMENRK